MNLYFQRLEGTREAISNSWHLRGIDKNGNPVEFYVRHVLIEGVKRFLTYVKADDVNSVLIENMLCLRDEKNLEYRADWEYNPDQPRNLAKCVTVT